jgi:hypothetical protein
MDAGALGGVIGIGVMVCGIISYSCYDKRNIVIKRWNRFFSREHYHQSLLPVLVTNPRVVRSDSKKFQMREIVLRK